MKITLYLILSNCIFLSFFAHPAVGQKLTKIENPAISLPVYTVNQTFSNAATNLRHKAYVFKDKLYYLADFSNSGLQLIQSDGTYEGTKPLKVLNGSAFPTGEYFPNNQSSFEAIEVNGYLFFTANSNTDKGFTLWRTDGTAEGTINLGISLGKERVQNNPTPLLRGNFRKVGNKLLFVGWNEDSALNISLYETDGTVQGTKIIARNLQLSIGEFIYSFFTQISDDKIVYSIKNDGFYQYTNDVSQKISPFPDANPTVLTMLGNTLFSTATNYSEGVMSLFSSTNQTNKKIAEFPYDKVTNEGRVNISFLTTVADKLIFVKHINTGSDDSQGNRIFKRVIFAVNANGSSEDLLNINTTDGPGRIRMLPQKFKNSLIFFTGESAYITNGTKSGSKKLVSFGAVNNMYNSIIHASFQLSADSFNPVSFYEYNNTAYFFRYVSSYSGKAELYKTDGTPEGTKLINGELQNFTNIIESEGVLYFSDRFNLYKITRQTGTPEKLIAVTDYQFGTNVYQLSVLNKKILVPIDRRYHVLDPGATPQTCVVKIEGNTVACVGQILPLKITYMDVSGDLFWQKDGKDIPNEKGNTFGVTTPGNYSVRFQNTQCTSTSNQIQVSFNDPKINLYYIDKISPPKYNRTGLYVDLGGTLQKIEDIYDYSFYHNDSLLFKKGAVPYGSGLGKLTSSTPDQNLYISLEKPVPGTATTVSYLENTGTYRLDILDYNYCSATSSFKMNAQSGTGDALSVNISSASVIAYHPQTIKITATVSVTSGVTYQWQKNGANIAGATASAYEVKESGNYVVVITSNGKSAVSNVIAITINVPLAKEPEVSGIEVTVFPNPAEQQVNAEIRLAEELPVRVEIYTADGRRVKLWHSEGGGYVHRPVITLGSGLEGQQLLLKVTTDKAFVTKKIFVKSR